MDWSFFARKNRKTNVGIAISGAKCLPQSTCITNIGIKQRFTRAAYKYGVCINFTFFCFKSEKTSFQTNRYKISSGDINTRIRSRRLIGSSLPWKNTDVTSSYLYFMLPKYSSWIAKSDTSKLVRDLIKATVFSTLSKLIFVKNWK